MGHGYSMLGFVVIVILYAVIGLLALLGAAGLLVITGANSAVRKKPLNGASLALTRSAAPNDAATEILDVTADVRMRHVPELHFHYDDSVDKGERIDALLRQDAPLPSDDDNVVSGRGHRLRRRGTRRAGASARR